MAAGMKYDLTPIEVEKEALRFETVYRLSGGFNLEDDKLVEGSFLPSACPLCVDFVTRRAKAVKNVRVSEDVAADALVIKIAKGSLAYVGMFLGNGTKGTTVSSIDKTNVNYDSLTVTALGATAKAGEVLFEASAAGGTTVKHKANLLNYARTKVEAGATVTAIGQVFEIKETKLSTPISEKDKESLGDRFMFV